MLPFPLGQVLPASQLTLWVPHIKDLKKIQNGRGKMDGKQKELRIKNYIIKNYIVYRYKFPMVNVIIMYGKYALMKNKD